MVHDRPGLLRPRLLRNLRPPTGRRLRQPGHGGQAVGAHLPGQHQEARHGRPPLPRWHHLRVRQPGRGSPVRSPVPGEPRLRGLRQHRGRARLREKRHPRCVPTEAGAHEPLLSLRHRRRRVRLPPPRHRHRGHDRPHKRERGAENRPRAGTRRHLRPRGSPRLEDLAVRFQRPQPRSAQRCRGGSSDEDGAPHPRVRRQRRQPLRFL